MPKIRVYHDYDCENPLEWSPVEITYRADARTILGNRPIATYDDLMEIVNSGDYLALPIYAYVHGQVALRVGRDWHDGTLPQGHAEFDSGLSGYALYAKDKIREDYGVQRISRKTAAEARDYVTTVVKEFSAWLNGDCYFVVIRDDEGEFIDSSSGFIGDSWQEWLRAEYPELIDGIDLDEIRVTYN